MPFFSVLLGDIIQPFSVYQYYRSMGVTGPALDAAKNQLESDVVRLVTIFSLVGVGALAACYVMQTGYMIAGERQARKVRTKFIRSAMNQDLTWFDENKAGDLTTRLTSDIILFQDGISEKVALALAYGIQFLTGFIIAFVKSWKLTLALLATIPLFGLSGGIVGKVFAEGTTKSQAAYAKAGAIAQETLLNIRTVAAFGGQEKALSKFSSA
ncbi:ATP-binding cassette, sub-B (MDR TAP), member 4, partial [Coelomomyces lativittatus]